MNILSIQSRVAYGHVGNSAAAFLLQRLGHQVWPVDTVYLSNHLGYPTWSGRFFPPEEVRAIVDGLDKLGLFGRCDAILSGYIGDAGAVARDTVMRVRRAAPNALYACDPVMGDWHSGLYVKPEVPPVFARELLPQADFTFPNAFELRHLTGREVDTIEAVLAACAALRATMRPGAIAVATSLRRQDAPAGQIETLAASDREAWLVATPYFDLPAHGTGDSFAALFLGYYLRDRRVDDALARAVSVMYEIVAATANKGVKELELIATQQALDAPAPTFKATRLR